MASRAVNVYQRPLGIARAITAHAVEVPKPYDFGTGGA